MLLHKGVLLPKRELIAPKAYIFNLEVSTEAKKYLF